MKRVKLTHPDFVQLAAAVVALASDESDQVEDTDKDPKSVAAGRKGGKKGGLARKEKLTPEQRSEIAKRAAQARWKK